MRSFISAIGLCAVVAVFAVYLSPFDGAFYINVARVRLADGTERNVTPSAIWTVCAETKCTVAVLYNQGAGDGAFWSLQAEQKWPWKNGQFDLRQPDVSRQPAITFVRFSNGWHPVIEFDGKSSLN